MCCHLSAADIGIITSLHRAPVFYEIDFFLPHRDITVLESTTPGGAEIASFFDVEGIIRNDCHMFTSGLVSVVLPYVVAGSDHNTVPSLWSLHAWGMSDLWCFCSLGALCLGTRYMEDGC